MPILRSAQPMLSSLLLTVALLAASGPARAGDADQTTAPEKGGVANEGPVRPPVLDGPGAAAAADDRDDGIVAARPPEDDGWRSKDTSCRVGGSVTMGVGFGGGMVERGAGATLNYGQDGNPFRPCADTGIGFSLSVSQSNVSGHPRNGAWGTGVWGGGFDGGDGYPYGYGSPYSYGSPYGYGRWTDRGGMDSWFANRTRP
ncbi:hypothetical protein [Nitrospirillum iridis]|uniref:Uncharacterized protein n=1 Tax=Nitrospirillum iridis TaxID=765888 RepID=A0A7X0B268_9PROT|nr:hypothetical protein [Nitrospirillum iridis]MBB6252879.1 hypothetical protein [Nitrospirillum iridis]